MSVLWGNEALRPLISRGTQARASPVTFPASRLATESGLWL